ncbi:hypothetical protein AAJ72_10360 [Citromicrobium sp. RCC1885]|nr:hypothetical protein WG75_07055 [Citromicrobium sp. WPS32]KPM23286.1 hypothetical protein AAJ72_10360 [Citromicrobium sp. RCC1885]KPM26693.1 hypothetical protein AAJ74_11100 [Citromicrobium sp. RCC1878]MAO04693.1 hypothetical protein [Citromicrobium sp.]OAM08787.1 hypothetical protein A0U43_09205 [Citromicrobium sp. RCC1897]
MPEGDRRMRKIALLTAALGLAAAPVGALAGSRDTAPVESGSELGGTGGILAAMGIAVVIATVILVTDGNDDPDLSVSN